MKLEADLQDSRREGVREGIKEGIKNSIEMMREGGLSDDFIFNQIKEKHPNTFSDEEIRKLMAK